MQTQTGTRSRQKREPKQPRLDLDKLIIAGGGTHPHLFWLLCLVDYRQKADALTRLIDRMFAAAKRDELTIEALFAARSHFTGEERDSVRHCLRVGLLPFCWQGTRALDEVEVAA